MADPNIFIIWGSSTVSSAYGFECMSWCYDSVVMPEPFHRGYLFLICPKTSGRKSSSVLSVLASCDARVAGVCSAMSWVISLPQ